MYAGVVLRYTNVMDVKSDLHTKLHTAGLRPTRQRLALAQLLFSKGNRHICAEDLHASAQGKGVTVSLATIYNTLKQFTEAGLLREVALEGDRSYYDTNTANHFHFFDPKRGQLMDIPAENLTISGLPAAPSGMVVDRIDVIVRLRAKS